MPEILAHVIFKLSSADLPKVEDVSDNKEVSESRNTHEAPAHAAHIEIVPAKDPAYQATEKGSLLTFVTGNRYVVRLCHYDPPFLYEKICRPVTQRGRLFLFVRIHKISASALHKSLCHGQDLGFTIVIQFPVRIQQFRFIHGNVLVFDAVKL